MPYDFEFENIERGAMLRFSGAVDDNQLIDAVKAVYQADPRRRLRYQIADFTASTRFDVVEDQLRAAAFLHQQAGRHYPRQRMAIVGTDEYFKGADRRYAIYIEVWARIESRAFATLAEARRWIEENTE